MGEKLVFNHKVVNSLAKRFCLFIICIRDYIRETSTDLDPIR
jgi:hypothetical protein